MNETDLKWVAIEKEYIVIIKTVPRKFSFLGFRELSHSSEMQN